ncbi:chromodomain-helicase-DNA-binding protein 8 isoform X1 [Hydra vulgaris]|uniref:chromodomain-helicase-DNA-binding protein 8 isoform X1 n=1 Tax=Hydra vulgaris TaxID=6087 RepID=UPI000640E722|nr:chromodomain-helicase-DNA-binding protein 8 [Hydra vulgaris]
MNPNNYMSFYNPNGGSQDIGSNYQNSTDFGLPSGGSFLDMINSPSPHLIPNPQNPNRFNPYSNQQYPYSQYAMENSAARLQQFARQMVPRPSNMYVMPGQNSMSDPIAFNMEHMAQMRMKQMDFNSHPRYRTQLQSWPRMPHSMPILQQQESHQTSMDVMQQHNSSITPDSLQLSNMQSHRNNFRKMPVLEEAPITHRGLSSQSFNFIGQNFSDSSPGSTLSPSYSQNKPTATNISSVESLNLPNIDFNSSQQQLHQSTQQQLQQQGGLSSFMEKFSAEHNISPNIPLSPKLTHFGPSSVTTFDQVQTTNANQKLTSSIVQTPPYGPHTPNPTITGSPAAPIKYAPVQNFPMSPSFSLTSNQQNNQMNFRNYFLGMQQLQQQINQLKQGPQTQQVLMQIQMYSQQYQNIFRQYEIAKQQSENSYNQQQVSPIMQTSNQKTLKNSQHEVSHQQQQSLTQSSDIPSQSFLEEISDGLDLPDLGEYDNKDSFLSENSKTESMFPSGFIETSEIFGGGPMYAETPKIENKENAEHINSIARPSNFNMDGNEKPKENHPIEPQIWQSPRPQSSQMFQMFQPLRPNVNVREGFLPFPFQQYGMQQQLPFMQNMSISELMSKSAMPTNFSMPNSVRNMNNYNNFGSAPLQPSFPDASKPKGGKGKRGGKVPKGPSKPKIGRPQTVKKKKKDKKADFEPADFDNLAPNDFITDDAGFLDPDMRRSLRERTKKKNYKDDFDYNLSDEENKESKGSEVDSKGNALEPVISGGANQLLAYRPNLEVEGEIAVIERILAMRVSQQETVQDDSQEKSTVMVEEYFVKYKAYSYLHCEWGTAEQLAKKDKRVHAKIKRYQQKRDSTLAFLNELDDEPFNPEYIEIDRVLDMQTTQDPVTNEKFNHYLVKWRALPYEESTWELQMNIDDSIIKQFHELKKPPPPELRHFVNRPIDVEWKPYTVSPVYKNGNKLHDYQLEGLNWLTFCWYKRINCILADEMGLGKTIQSISLLCAIKQYGIRGPFLVIAPLSTIVNWQREFEEWTDINAIVYHGSAQSRLHIQQYEMRYKDENGEDITSIYKFEAIITTYEMVLNANSFLCTIPFRCLIIDEAHRLKNQKCKLMEGLNNLQMEHRVLLTGTPLQNNVEELFSLLNFVEPTRFPSQAAFLFEFGNLKTEGQVAKLQEILKPMMLRRLKEDVAQNIASKEETIVEVELTTIQKKFYRAILEKNFSFLAKGAGYSNLPNLMNTMMELRKCCNHPFLINGAEEKIVSEYPSIPGDTNRALVQMNALIESSGKMVLIDKLLPKLKAGGHKVLIFSQMIKVLNLIEDYLIAKRFLFERIDGGIQGNNRQAAIDRFCKTDSDRFVFLLCTRAGGLGINLTAADTVIIFDSDWNPQNDLQAQARCHRIGQDKPVKVYRLICRNTYEREMFDRASLKLGLDKAVLQNMNVKEGSSSGQQAMSKKEVEDLLKKGAYGAVMEADDNANKFCEEDIDQILERRTQVIQIQSEGKGSTFAKASFVSDKARQDISLDDPDFWQKWAKKASVDIDELDKDDQLIVDEPRRRKQTKRFGNDEEAALELSDFESDDETYEPLNKSSRVPRLSSGGQSHIERTAWTRVECFKVEKNLLIYGWARWQEIISHAHFRQDMHHSDIEAIARTILAYCFRHYRTDEKSKQFFINLINESAKKAPPKNDKFDIANQILSSASPKGTRGRKRGSSGRNTLRRLTHQYSKPALIECGLDWQSLEEQQMIVDPGYRKHLQQHCNKIMSRIRLLCFLKDDIIADAASSILNGDLADNIKFLMPPPDGEVLTEWWDVNADKSLLIGTFKHGYEKYRLIRNDPCLYFYQKVGPAPEKTANLNTENSTEQNEIKKKKEHDDEDSFNESDEEKEDTCSSTNSPVANFKESSVDASKSNDLRWPTPTDMNTRLRRLINGLFKSSEKEHLEGLKAEKEKQRQERQAIVASEKQKKKLELQQKWTRRDEADFYRVVSNFGVIYDKTKKSYDWKKFRELARLEKKNDDSLTCYFEDFMSMCRRVCKKSTPDEIKSFQGSSHIEEISEERANRCIERIKLLSKIRDVLHHDQINERLKLCEVSPDFPVWWEKGKHDKALLEGVARYGLVRTEYTILMDPKSVFKALALKPHLQSGVAQETNTSTPPSSTASSNPNISTAASNSSPATIQQTINGVTVDTEEHKEKSILSPSIQTHSSSENRFSFATEEYAHLLPTWPKEKSIVYHLQKVVYLILKGEWPKLMRYDNSVSKSIPSTSVNSVALITRSELITDKPDMCRGQMAAPIHDSRDFKIKSIDGLKLTVKPLVDFKKNKRKADNSKLFGEELINAKMNKNGEKSNDYRTQDAVNRIRKENYSKVQIHIPKSMDESSSEKLENRKPVIHFPSNVKIGKINSSSVIKNVNEMKLKNPIKLIQRDVRIDDKIPMNDSKENLFYSKDKTSDKIELIKTSKEIVINENRSDNKTSIKHDYKDTKNKVRIDVKKPDQPIAIHLNSPNSNVRIQGSKIEVKEKASTKREIDLSNVILRVPDPSKFLANQDLKKKKAKMLIEQNHENKLTTSEPTERFTSPNSLSEPLKVRPERSAKKRAKDSILEMTEAENVNHIDYKYSPTHHSDFHTPLAIKSRDYYRNELYNDRVSPFREGRSPIQNEVSSYYHSNYSPSKYVRSPSVQSVSDHAISPRTHISPSASDSLKHHYTQPLSPRYYDDDSHFYPERSKSPKYYDYVDKEHYTCRKSPLFSAHSHDKHSPSKRKEDKIYKISEQFKTTRVKHYNPHTVPEDRLLHDLSPNEYLDGKYSDKRATSSLSVEPSYNYQPLSRTRMDVSDFKTGKISERKVQVKPRNFYQPSVKVYEKSQVITNANNSQPALLSNPMDKKRVGDEKVSRDPPTSFYPTEQSSKSSKLSTQCSVIEIKQNYTAHERSATTPTSKERKNAGSLLEMKIQGLKKQRLEQLSDSSNDGHGVTSPDFKSISTDLSRSASSSTNAVSLETILPKLDSTQAVKYLNLDNIAKNLTKSAEKSCSDVSKKTVSENLVESDSALSDTLNVNFIPSESTSNIPESRITTDPNMTCVNKFELKTLES